MAGSGLDVDSVIERLLSVRGQPNNRTVQLAEGEIRALCATARWVAGRGTNGHWISPGFSRVLFLNIAHWAARGRTAKGSQCSTAQTRVQSGSFRKRVGGEAVQDSRVGKCSERRYQWTASSFETSARRPRRRRAREPSRATSTTFWRGRLFMGTPLNVSEPV